MYDRTTGELPAAAVSLPIDGVDYHASYRAKVVQQQTVNGVLQLDIAPLDTRFPTFQGVPCMFGIPGAAFTIQPGSFVFFTWWNGQPGQLYVENWDPRNSVVDMYLTGTNIFLNAPAGTAPAPGGVARLNDQVSGTTAFLTQVNALLNMFDLPTVGPVIGYVSSASPDVFADAGQSHP